MTADEIKALLKLEPHPIEGGFFRRTYTCSRTVDSENGPRNIGSAIYYLLEPARSRRCTSSLPTRYSISIWVIPSRCCNSIPMDARRFSFSGLICLPANKCNSSFPLECGKAPVS